MRTVVASTLTRLVDGGAQVVEVLSREEYAEAHIPGALNLPLKELDAAAASRLERTRAVVVYCHDGL